jgi:hypothetical protein
MSRPIKCPKIIKTCPICSVSFETRSGSQYEKTYCSRVCSGKAHVVENKKEKYNIVRRERYALLSEEEKEIELKYARKYSKDHRQELNEKAKEYRKSNPNFTREASKRARKKMRCDNPTRLIWLETKKRAKKRNIPFEIDISDIVIPKICPILGLELSFGIGRVHDESPSLDRIIPEMGYVKGNCYIISSKANRMKQENTLETLEKIISYIKERMK